MKFSIQIRMGRWMLRDGKIYRWTAFKGIKGKNTWHDWEQVLPPKPKI